MGRYRNTGRLVEIAWPHYRASIDASLMQVTMTKRRGKVITMPDGREVVEFVNCSYLGLDLHPDVIAGAQKAVEEWGVHFCCARSRFSIGPHEPLEEGLSELFGGRAITFPSVSSAHLSILPLLASGVLFRDEHPRRVCFLFDHQAHASMQILRPILADEATVETVAHNDLDQLRDQARRAQARGETVVFVGDGVYSMGGVCPVVELLGLADELGLYLYIDDAHGTSVYGEKGEGYVKSRLAGDLPENVFVNFSLAKGFGCNGGGVTVPSQRVERLVRSFGQTYAFSAPLDFSIIGAASAALELHRDGTVRRLQQELRARVRIFDTALGDTDVPFNPIRMHMVGAPELAIEAGRALVEAGYFVSVAFFPVVPLGAAQLRFCITVAHTPGQLEGLARAVRDLP